MARRLRARQTNLGADVITDVPGSCIGMTTDLCYFTKCQSVRLTSLVFKGSPSECNSNLPKKSLRVIHYFVKQITNMTSPPDSSRDALGVGGPGTMMDIKY